MSLEVVGYAWEIVAALVIAGAVLAWAREIRSGNRDE